MSGEQLDLFGPRPRDKQTALERAAELARTTPAELRQRAHIIDAEAVQPLPRDQRPGRRRRKDKPTR